MRGAKFFAFLACIWWLGEGQAQPGETQTERPPLKIKSITHQGEGKLSEAVPVDAGSKSMPDPIPTGLDVRASEPGIIDLLQASDGVPILGKIQGYASSMLQFVNVSGQSISVPRRKIVAIDLDVNRQTPDSPLPLQLEPEQDIVVLNDGIMLTAELSVITSEIVGTTKRALPRDQVDLIVIAPDQIEHPPVLTDDPVNTGDPPEPQPDSDGAKGESSESNITRPPNSTDPVKPCPDDQPLGGWVRVKYEFNERNTCRTEVDQLAWFRLLHGDSHGPRDPLNWNDWLRLLIAPTVSYEVSHGTCDDLPNDDQVCEAQGADIRARLDWKEEGVQVRFDPMKPSLEVSFPDQVRPNRRYSCRKAYGGGEGPLNHRHGRRIHIGPSYGLTAYDELKALDYRFSDGKFFVAVDPGACWQAQHPIVVECVNHRDRYAVIPFGDRIIGVNQSKVIADRQAVPTAQLDWQVCCGCGRKPAGGPIPIPADTFNEPEEDDCYRETYYLQSWYEQALAQVGEELADAYAEFEQYRRQLEEDHSAYKDAMTTCGIRDVVLTVMGEWLFRGFRHVGRPPASRLALPPRSGAIIPRAPSSPGITVNQFKRIMTALSGFAAVTEGSKLITGEMSTNLLKQRLFGCESILPQAVYDAALRFIQNRQEVGRVAQKMGHYYSKLVQTQLEYHFAMLQPYQECLVCADEKGISTYDCWYSTVSPGTPPWKDAKPTHPKWRHEMSFWLEVLGNIFDVDVPPGVLIGEPVTNRFGDKSGNKYW